MQSYFVVALGFVLVGPVAAVAEPDPTADVVFPAIVAMPMATLEPVAIIPEHGPFGSSRIGDDMLSGMTGQADVNKVQQLAIAKNVGVVSGNRINGDSVTGLITIDNGAFENLNGLSIVSANTGNNVSINASMNVNVSFQH